MADFTITQLLIFQFVLILFNALFACAEIAVISVNENKLKKIADEGNKKAKKLLSLTSQPAKFLATIQVGITLAGFLGSAFAADNFSDRIVNWLIGLGVNMSAQKLDVIAVIGITLVLSYITLIFGELVPKRIAMQSAEKIALFMSGFIYLIAKIFVPIVWFLTYSTNLVLKILGINPEEKNEQITEEEIKIMVDVGSESGNIDDIEKSIIHNIFEFDDKLAEEIVTHRTDTIFINIDDPIEKWEQTIIQHRFSVYPIYQNEHDNIVGIINIKDFFKFNKQGKQTVINNAVQPPFFVSKSKHINELFIIMQKNRSHFAVVVDEYGGVYGILTMNDVLEQIVGELEDDHQMPVTCPNISKIKDKTWKIKGSTPISEVVSCLKIKLPEDMYDTFGGFVMTLLGEIPSKNQKIEVAYNNIKIVISNIKSRRIEETIVTFED